MEAAGRPGAPASSALDADVSFLLARASAVSTAAGNQALAPFGLKVRSYAVLALAAQSPPSQRELAARLRLDPSQIVTLVDDLETRGLVRRRPSPEDRRTRIVQATEAGAALVGTARVAVEEAERAVHASLTPEEAEALRGLLLRIAYADLS